jgi:hypothetical protein
MTPIHRQTVMHNGIEISNIPRAEALPLLSSLTFYVHSEQKVWRGNMTLGHLGQGQSYYTRLPSPSISGRGPYYNSTFNHEPIERLQLRTLHVEQSDTTR